MPVFRLRTLGGAALERDGVALDTVGAQRKTLSLLALLAASRRQGISRDRVAACLWPESPTERARGALNQALHVARRQLGSPAAVLGTSELRLNPEFVVSDVDEFLTAMEAGELERAVGVYGGPFLDGFHLPGSSEFEAWTATQRDDLGRRYAAALEGLALAAEQRGEAGTAVEWLRRLQATDPFSARTTLWLMRLLDAAGERVAALRCAQVHETLLREELGSLPDPEVAALADQLRAGGGQPEVDDRSDRTGSATALQPSVSDDPLPTAVAMPDTPAPPAGRSRRTAAVLVIAAAVIIAVALLLRPTRDSGDVPPLANGMDRPIAVLPFTNSSGDSAIDHLSAGLTEELASALTRVEGLTVAPLTVTQMLARQGLGREAIADSLRAAAVVEGTISGASDRLRVTVQLVDARSSRVVWADTHDAAGSDVASIPGQMARAIAGTLYPRRTAGAGGAPAAPRPPRDAEAYDLYLRGRHAWKQRSREGIRQAIVFFEGALERDAAFAMAYVGLAASYVNCSNFGFCNVREALARAEVAADRALALDARLAEGHAVKGFVLASRLDLDEAEAALQRALGLDPDLTWAHHYYTLLLLMRGRTDEALEQNRRALGTDPLSLPANSTRGIILLQRGDFAGAERELQRALALSPGLQLTLYYLGALYAARGRHAEAAQLLDRAAHEAPGFTGVPGARAFLLQRAGRQPAADSLLAAIEAQAGTGEPRARVNLALAYAVMGRLDEAFALLEQVEWDVPSLIELRADPLLHALRADPRYPGLLRRIGADG